MTSSTPTVTNHAVSAEHAQTHDATPHVHDITKSNLHDQPIDNLRRIRVVVIGAGFSGIYHGIRIPERLRNCELVIYEKNAGIGGTWYENRYPGAACDVPSHSYQYSFNPKHDWSSMYAPWHEILDYLESTARKYGADRFIKLQHEVRACRWQQELGMWNVTVKKPDGETFVDHCNVLISARGNLSHKRWPEIPGLQQFQGDIMHSAGWNEHIDLEGKRVGVIGSGSSAIQIIPQLQKVKGIELNCFIRSPTWVSPPFAQAIHEEVDTGRSLDFSPEQIASFKQDPKAWLDFRLKVAVDSNSVHAMVIRGSTMQVSAQKAMEDLMRERLKKKPEYLGWLKPAFAPGCRRLTPGPGFLEALVEDNVRLTRAQILRIDQKGVVTDDQTLHELDVLVCATGFHAGAAPPFPITGLDGVSMRTHWHERATNYLSIATDKFHNLFFMLGPNGSIGEGSLTMMMESAGDYIVKAIRKIQKENIKSMEVKAQRVRDFLHYCDRYFKDTVYVGECSSWYRLNGQGVSGDVVTGLWPGSGMHCIEALRSPRWEDFDYEYLPASNGAEVSPLAWLGNGWTVSQLAQSPRDVDLAFYITPEVLEREIGIPEHPQPELNEQYRIRPWSY